MNVHVTDLQAHYKQVRRRVRVQTAGATQLYDKPIGPIRVVPRDVLRVNSVPTSVETFRSVRDAALRKYNMTLEQFNGPQRFAEFVRCRHEVWYHVQKNTKLSLPRIGQLSGGRDHTTIMNGIARYKVNVLGEHSPRIARKRVYELARYAANKDDNSRKRSGKKRRPAALVEG